METVRGYWEPHTSSIDFCERNYLHSNHIVELHNTWSSILGISFFGITGILYANPTQETRYTVAYLVLVLIGVGSAGLHGSLHWIFQSSDELPMVYLVTCLNYMALEVDAPVGRPKYPWLPTALGIFSMVNTGIYYYFQQIYLVFLSTFVLGVVIMAVLTYQLAMLKEGRSHASKKLFKIGTFSYLLVGSPVWIFEMLQCHKVLPLADALPGILQGATPHVVWHFTAGFGTYCIICFFCCCRMEALNIPFEVTMVNGILPTISKVEGKKIH